MLQIFVLRGEVAEVGVITFFRTIFPCAGYLGYPFQNKQIKSFVEHLARDVDKQESLQAFK